MLREDGRVVGRTPHLRHASGGLDKEVSANGHGRDACLLDVNSVVYTTRAARASIAHAHDNVVTLPRHLLNHARLGWLGRRRLAMILDAGDAETLVKQ